MFASGTAAAGNASAHQAYLKGGFAGIGAGYAYGISNAFTARADFTTIGSFNRNSTSGDLAYQGQLKYDQASIYGDWFPFKGAFRITSGLNVRNAKLEAKASPSSAGTVTIGDTTVGFDGNDSAYARVKMPTVAPYIGIGWGHNVASGSKGFSFVADIGLSIGKPKVDLQVNPALLGKLNAATGGQGNAEINKQLKDLRDDAKKIKAMPQIYIGVAYKF